MEVRSDGAGLTYMVITNTIYYRLFPLVEHKYIFDPNKVKKIN
jgi:hypothetical protein